MTVPLFLTTEELRSLTGFALKSRQIDTLRAMGITFRVNGCGKPVVTRAAVEGGTLAQQSIALQAWQPAVLHGGR